MKTCPDCRCTSDVARFHRNKSRSDGLDNYCAKCSLARHKVWRDKNPQWLRGYSLRKYGITMEQYQRMLVDQLGVCAICGLPEVVVTRGTSVSHLAVDHDHETGQVRGLLCHKCNSGLGLLNHDIDRLLVAATYLEDHR